MARKAILKVREISQNCGIPSGLRELGITESAIPAMAEAALKVTRLMDNNPRHVSLYDAREIYRKAYHAVID